MCFSDQIQVSTLYMLSVLRGVSNQVKTRSAYKLPFLIDLKILPGNTEADLANTVEQINGANMDIKETNETAHLVNIDLKEMLVVH